VPTTACALVEIRLFFVGYYWGKKKKEGEKKGRRKGERGKKENLEKEKRGGRQTQIHPLLQFKKEGEEKEKKGGKGGGKGTGDGFTITACWRNPTSRKGKKGKKKKKKGPWAGHNSSIIFSRHFKKGEGKAEKKKGEGKKKGPSYSPNRARCPPLPFMKERAGKGRKKPR